jgi:hypothetical protein
VDVKFAGSGVGKTGAAAAGAEGSAAGAGGTFCWADALKADKENKTSVARLAIRRDMRIKLILLKTGEGSQTLDYTCTLTAMGNLRPIPNDLAVTFNTGAAC